MLYAVYSGCNDPMFFADCADAVGYALREYRRGRVKVTVRGELFDCPGYVDILDLSADAGIWS